ncbi:MAG: peptidylprolyl isomerase [Pseudomonadota bacterium]
MNRSPLSPAALGLAFALTLAGASPTFAQDDTGSPAEPAPGPTDYVNSADASEWTAIEADDLLVMTLAPDAAGAPREVIIQLIPAPFSQGWVQNIRTLARAKWYDATSVNRVQDNYVVQWGDPNYDNPEAAGKAKPLPDGLNTMRENAYTALQTGLGAIKEIGQTVSQGSVLRQGEGVDAPSPAMDKAWDIYAAKAGFVAGWPVAFGNAFQFAVGELEIPPDVARRYFAASEAASTVPALGALSKDEASQESRVTSSSLMATWPVHCYGMVGVGRNYSPDTGSGAELYTVIGHAPRHLDRNIALVGRIIAGMAHLSALPRGTGALGFYSAEEADKRTPIVSIRVASDLPEAERPSFEYLSTDSGSFARYADARANRLDPFFIAPSGGADVCNVPVPVRAVESAAEE